MNLKEVIDNYLKNQFINYAILIKGEWGSGKTFFVKKNIVDRYDNALYVSLYGISSIDTLSEKIYLEIIKSKATTNCVSKIFQKMYKILFFRILFFIPVCIFKLLRFIYELLFRLIWIVTYNLVNLKFNINLSSLNKKDFYGILKMYKKLNKYILIIDDLERCSIPIEETMGFINDFVEHNNMKCILIANEEEIYKIQSENIEMKILTATNEMIEFYDSDKDNDRYSNKTKGKLDIKDLRNRIEYLYNDNNKYKIIKEKLIGKEFIFVPNLEDIYDKIAFKYKKYEDFYDILNKTKLSVINTMKFNNFNNIRVLDFYFDNFYHIHKYIDDIVKECKISENFIYSNICSSIINGCIAMKKGYRIDGLLGGKKFDYVSYNEDKSSIFSSNMFLDFDFVNEYLVFNYIEKSNIEVTLKEFADSNCDKLSDDDPFNLLNEYWYYSSNEINKILNEIYDNINSNKYSNSLHRLIIKKIASLEAMGYKEPIIKQIVELIKIKIASGVDIKIDEHELFQDNKASTIYANYVNQIKRDIKKGANIKNDTYIDKLLENENWGESFYKYVEKIKERTLIEKRFFSMLDYKKIVNKLLESEIRDVYYFVNSLDHIYGFSNLKDYYISDLECLKGFKKILNSKLKEKKIQDPMLKYPFNILQEKIDSVIDLLER